MWPMCPGKRAALEKSKPLGATINEVETHQCQRSCRGLALVPSDQAPFPLRESAPPKSEEEQSTVHGVVRAGQNVVVARQSVAGHGVRAAAARPSSPERAESGRAASAQAADER